MLGLGLLPLCLVTLLWSFALARRPNAPTAATRIARSLTVIALFLAGTALYIATTGPDTIASAPAESRLSELASLVATALWTMGSAYVAQVLGLLVVAIAWLRALRSTPRSNAQ